MTKFAEKLKELRTENKMTKTELANKINVSHASTVYWESGAKLPTIDKIEALCNVFQVSSDYLIGLVD